MIRQRTRIEGCQSRPRLIDKVLTRHVDPGQMVGQLLTMAATAAVTSLSRSTSDGRRLMILPVAKRPGPGTDIPLCSVPLSLTWSLTGVSWPTPAAAAPPKRGGELIHGPEPRTHRKQPNGPDEFVARGWSKLVTP